MHYKMMRNATISLAAAVLPLTVSATPVEWPVSSGGNGHYYEVVAADGTAWDDANAAVAAASPINLGSVGLRGYLATLTTAAENSHVDGLRIASGTNKTGFENSELWVGGFQDPPASAAGANWFWVNGEGAIGTFYWLPGEPNDSGGSEFHLAIGWSGLSGWNDEASLDGIYGSVWEYEVVITAADDTANASSGVPVVINVIGNDTIPAGLALVNPVTIESQPASDGNSIAVVKPDNSIEYTSDTTFAGTDTFQYRVTDANGAYAIATVSVEVSATVSSVNPGNNQLFFNQALNPVPGGNNPLSAAFQLVPPGGGGEVEATCCLVLDTREGTGTGKKYGAYNPVDFDIGLAIADTLTNPSCGDVDMPAVPAGAAILRPWQRVVPASKRDMTASPTTTAREYDLGVCVIRSEVELQGVAWSAEQAENVLGHKLNYRVANVDYRPFTGAVTLDPQGVSDTFDSVFIDSVTADVDESRSAKKYSDVLLTLNTWHYRLHDNTKSYLSRKAAVILASIEAARLEGCVENNAGFLDSLKTLVEGAKFDISKNRANPAIAKLENATRLALLIAPYESFGDPYGLCPGNWKGLWTGHTMALKYAACNEMKHATTSASTLDGACLIAPDILAEMPPLPGF